ncbi:MAG: type II toxin-antitoxin system RelE/ParE family toxin [Hyphomicrobiales bacterium]|nr:type II toxin-antitoxin system RelE/ParE family toxin [Hyphomicrobiales bacterium]
MSKPYLLVKGASADLEDIIRFTNEQWGEAQCRSYIDQLERAATALAKGEGVFKELPSIHPMLRMAKSGRHFIFCLPRSGSVPLILAILHERMDIMARLQNRLG